MIIDSNDFELNYFIITNEDLQVTGTGCVIRNCTIYNGTLNIDEDCEVYNTVVFNPGGEDINIAAGKTVTAKNNCFKDSAKFGTGTYTDSGESPTKWSADPKFRKIIDDDFRLRHDSPCRNAGDNSVWSGTASIIDYAGNAITDAAGDIVAAGDVVDIGALECQLVSTPIPSALKKGGAIHFLVEVDFNGLVKRFGTADISVPNYSGSAKFFDGFIKSMSPPGSSFNFDSFTYSIASVSIEIANEIRLQDHETARRLSGATGTIYIYCHGLDWSDIEENGIIFRGVFQKDWHDSKTYAFNLVDELETKTQEIPSVIINSDTWPNHRTLGYGGSEAGKPAAIVYGDWPGGVPLNCVDTAAYKYLACGGVPKSVDADYTATTENVYDKNNHLVGAANYTFYPDGIDGEGNVVAYFDMTADWKGYEPMSCSIRGLMDGSGEITGAAGTLLEHPGDILRDLLPQHMNIESLDIDLVSIQNMKTFMPGIKFCTIVNNTANGVDVVDRILYQCLAARFQLRGKFGVWIFDPNPVGAASLRRFDQIKPAVRMTKTPRDLLCNDLRVEYGLNPSSGRYESDFTLDRTNNSDCAASYKDYGARPRQTLSLADVQDTTTAEALASRFVQYRAYRHDIAEIEVPYPEAWDIQEGDVRLLTVAEGASQDGAGWVDEKCVLIERTFGPQTICQKWWRVAV